MQNLRAEVRDEQAAKVAAIAERVALAAERDTLRADLTAATEKITEAEKAAADSARALLVDRALREHGLDADLAEFLTGADEDAVMAQAARLAGVKPKPTEEEPPAEGENDGEKPPAPTSRPTPALTPGHGGEPPVVPDFDAIADAARRG